MIRPDESTNQALRRLGFERRDHVTGDDVCHALGSAPLGCVGRHVVRTLDGSLVCALGCSAPVSRANEWIAAGCPEEI